MGDHTTQLYGDYGTTSCLTMCVNVSHICMCFFLGMCVCGEVSESFWKSEVSECVKMDRKFRSFWKLWFLYIDLVYIYISKRCILIIRLLWYLFKTMAIY